MGFFETQDNPKSDIDSVHLGEQPGEDADWIEQDLYRHARDGMDGVRRFIRSLEGRVSDQVKNDQVLSDTEKRLNSAISGLVFDLNERLGRLSSQAQNNLQAGDVLRRAPDEINAAIRKALAELDAAQTPAQQVPRRPKKNPPAAPPRKPRREPVALAEDEAPSGSKADERLASLVRPLGIKPGLRYFAGVDRSVDQAEEEFGKRD